MYGLQVSGPSVASVQVSGRPASIALSVPGVRSRTAVPETRSKSAAMRRVLNAGVGEFTADDVENYGGSPPRTLEIGEPEPVALHDLSDGQRQPPGEHRPRDDTGVELPVLAT